MRITAIRLLTAATFAFLGACGTSDDTAVSSSTVSAPVSDPGTAADEPTAMSHQTEPDPSATVAAPQVSRTREGNGGIIAVAGESTMEFDYAPPQGHCRASDGKFVAKGIDIDDDKASVSFKYESVVAPDTGRVVGQVFQLDLLKGGYVPWATNSSSKGAVDDISEELLPGGGTSLTVTGIMYGFQQNHAATGKKVPFRMETTCGQ